ncbi:MAG: signal peptidase I [Armatimonadetes bacterium]|nr:signal peptidase I [Armatimonadota bacterium]
METDNLWWVIVALVVLVVARLVVPNMGSLKDETRHSVLEFVDSGLIALVLVFFFIRPFVVQAFYIPSGSMRMTLLENDRILVNKWIYRIRPPHRQDIVVFKAPPKALGNSKEKKDFIKRLVGLPGDAVEVRSGAVYVNDKALAEPYLQEPPDYDMKIVDGQVYEILPYSQYPVQRNSEPVQDEREMERILVAAPGRVPHGSLLVFGDNRNDSNDGHKWGFLPKENLLGKAMVIFYPLQRARLLDHKWKSVARRGGKNSDADYQAWRPMMPSRALL